MGMQLAKRTFLGIRKDNPVPGGFMRAENVNLFPDRVEQRFPDQKIDTDGNAETDYLNVRGFPGSVFLEKKNGSKLELMEGTNVPNGNLAQIPSWVSLADDLTLPTYPYNAQYESGSTGIIRVDGVANKVIFNGDLYDLGVTAPTTAPTLKSVDSGGGVDPVVPGQAPAPKITSGIPVRVAGGGIEPQGFESIMIVAMRTDGSSPYQGIPSNVYRVTPIITGLRRM